MAESKEKSDDKTSVDKKAAEGERVLKIAPSDRVGRFESKRSKHTLDFDWGATDFARELTLEVGGRVASIELPEGFPEAALDQTVAVESLGITHSFSIESVPNRVSSRVAVTIDTAGVSSAFILRCGGTRLLDGWWPQEDWDFNPDDWFEIPWDDDPTDSYVPQALTQEERHVVSGGACRPDCIWTSILVGKWFGDWKLDKIQIFPKKVLHVYVREVVDTWASWHCEGGKWTWKHANSDRHSETERVWLKRE